MPVSFRTEEALAVVEHGVGEVAPLGVAGSCPGHRADEQVDLAGLEDRPPLGGGKYADLDRFRVSEHGGGDGAAQVDVEAHIVARFVQEAVAGNVGPAAADELAAVPDGLEATGVGRLSVRLRHLHVSMAGQRREREQGKR